MAQRRAGNTYTKVQGVVVSIVSQGTTRSQKTSAPARGTTRTAACPTYPTAVMPPPTSQHYSLTKSWSITAQSPCHSELQKGNGCDHSANRKLHKVRPDRHPAALQELGDDGRGVGAGARAQEGDHVHLPVDLGDVHGALAVKVARARVRAGLQQHLRDLLAPVPCAAALLSAALTLTFFAPACWARRSNHARWCSFPGRPAESIKYIRLMRLRIDRRETTVSAATHALQPRQRSRLCKPLQIGARVGRARAPAA